MSGEFTLAIFFLGAFDLLLNSRKFEELHDTERSDLAAEALLFYGLLYDFEANAREQSLDAAGRQHLRQQHARPVADHLRDWLTRQRLKVPLQARSAPGSVPPSS